jgi:hypothetical protein
VLSMMKFCVSFNRRRFNDPVRWALPRGCPQWLSRDWYERAKWIWYSAYSGGILFPVGSIESTIDSAVPNTNVRNLGGLTGVFQAIDSLGK